MKKTLFIVGVLAFGYTLKRNRELTGIIKNQKLTIDGLNLEVKNLAYHLGKKSTY